MVDNTFDTHNEVNEEEEENSKIKVIYKIIIKYIIV